MEDTTSIAIVTGAAGGIGLAIVERLARDGVRVYGVDLQQDVDERVRKAGGVAGFARDVTQDDVAREVVASVVEAEGQLDTVVNTVGIHRPAPFLDATAADFDALFNVNVRGTFLINHAAAHAMAERGGAIINFASIAVQLATANNAIYAASKGAIISLTRAMAVSLAPNQIRVNAIAPGPVDSPMNAAQREDPAYMARMVERVPLGRQGQPADIAGAVAFLVSDEATWITGEVLTIDGGISVLR